MRVAISEDGSDFVRRDWTELVRADPSGTFFHSPAYLKLYWEEFGHDFDLLLAFAEDGERLAGACAFERAGHVLRFLGGTEVTDYMGPVAKGVDREAVAGTMIATLRSRDDWTGADLRNIPEDSPWLEVLCKGAAAQGLQPLREEQDVCPYLELPPTWEEYLASLPSKLRHEIRRKSRRLEAERDGYRVVFSTRGNLGDDLDRFVALHRSSEGTKGRFMRPGMEMFFRRLGERFIEEGVFRLAFLEVGGEKIAGAIGFRYGRIFYLYNSGFDLAWRSLSPGMVLVGELIRACIEERLTGFDMLKGGLEYKYRFGSRPRRLFRLWMDSRP